MKKCFSERYGYTKVNRSIQLESISDDTRRELKDAAYLFLKDLRNNYPSRYEKICLYFWRTWMKGTIQEFDYNTDYACNSVKDFINETLTNGKWHTVFDLIEDLIPTRSDNNPNFNELINDLIEIFNRVLERTYSGYRIFSDQVTPINSEEEIKEIQQTLDSEITTSAEHIHRALELFSDRSNPDYRNSIKESISAVEAFCVKLTNKKETLAQALKVLKKQELNNVHPSLIEGLSKIYGYTNDKDRVRHAFLEQKQIPQEDARFMLVMCSAFVNYLQEKVRKNTNSKN